MWNIGFDRFSIFINYYDATLYNICCTVIGQSQSRYNPNESASFNKIKVEFLPSHKSATFIVMMYVYDFQRSTTEHYSTVFAVIS